MSPRLYKWDECARNMGLVYLSCFSALMRTLIVLQCLSIL
nr:MAG TPA: hypothetical protein [Caudoviricetes sp.]